jgi:hypothetical protein
MDHSPPLKTNVALFGFPLNMELLAPTRTPLAKPVLLICNTLILIAP